MAEGLLHGAENSLFVAQKENFTIRALEKERKQTRETVSW
jgi:hypothetical protein